MNKITKEILRLIKEYDAKGDQNESSNLIAERINLIIENNEPLVLMTFTCSTIKASEMFGISPWRYVSLSPIGNNLTNDLTRLANITKELKKIYQNTSLQVVIGNTDPYYIYTQQFLALDGDKDELWNKFALRWAKYKNELGKWVKERVPDISIEIVSWYEFEKEVECIENESFELEYQDVLSQIDRYANASDMNWEFEKLKRQFGKGGYFEGIQMLKEDILQDWVKRKFAEYAVQALWIRQYMPNAILIQNEKPSNLRTAMYQPLVRERCNEDFPVLYFCGVDNEGYQ